MMITKNRAGLLSEFRVELQVKAGAENVADLPGSYVVRRLLAFFFQLRSSVRHWFCGKQPPATQGLTCDLLLFFATTSEKEQLEEAARALGLGFQKKKDNRLGRYYYLGMVGNFEVIAVQTEMGPLTYEGSASKGIFFKLATSATAIVQLGMAFGIDPRRQHLGDVLVSSSLIPYDQRKAVAHQGHYLFDYSRAKAESARPSMLELFTKEASKPVWTFTVHVGAVLSGGTAIRCTKYRDELVAAFQLIEDQVVGGEMEGVGLLSVSPPDEPAWIVVKGISDFAEDEPSAEFPSHRNLACRNSATFVLSALMNAKQPEEGVAHGT